MQCMHVQIAFVDAHGRLLLQRVTHPSRQPVQLHTHVKAIRWHAESDILVALSLHGLVCIPLVLPAVHLKCIKHQQACGNRPSE